jgi:hypothetical protein
MATTQDAAADLVAEIQKLPRWSRAALADFFDERAHTPNRMPVLIAFVALIRSVSNPTEEGRRS